jgi:hypothetical protein
MTQPDVCPSGPTPCGLAKNVNISEEHGASTFRIELKIEAVCSSETLVLTYQTVRCHIPEDFYYMELTPPPRKPQIQLRSKSL